MVAAKKTGAKKTTARVRRPRTPAPPLPASVKKVAASVLALAEERLYDADDLGVTGATSRELKGARSGLMKTIKLDDGSRVTVTVAFRGPRAARAPRAKRTAAKRTTSK